ncbi:NADH-ubiquinone oxidoreductase chain 1 [Mortierella sp. GBA43]|nr:NADH-ubiquinone oxidoreductase chain 1 [Mortierella sp. GBA43]
MASLVTKAGSDPSARAAENVTVTVRVRPFNMSELKALGGAREVWQIQGNSQISYSDDYSMRERRTAADYTFDYAVTGSDNELIYNKSIRDQVLSAMEGYNSTVFAYGQTSSGKTYVSGGFTEIVLLHCSYETVNTMSNNNNDFSPILLDCFFQTMTGTENQPGITPRAVEDVFKYIHENSEREFLLRVSYLEIYNESIRDLLSPEAIDLRIHEDRRVIESRERAPTAPLSPTHTGSPVAGSAPGGRRMSFGLRPPSAVRVSQLNLIDLAGSEKASSDAERRKEGAYINKSLLTLGTVISRLTDDKGSHIPFRDSKLTRILQSSLSGNARVSVICTISPSLINVEESHNTLKFAARVKKIVTRAHTNQVMDDKALLEKYRLEISELRAQLLLTTAAAAEASSMGGGGVAIDKDTHAELSHLLERERLKHEEEMMEMNMVRNALKKRLEHLTKLILTSQSVNPKAIYPAGLPASTGDDSTAGNADTPNGGGLHSRNPSSGIGMVGGPLPGRYTVETTADGSVMEFPREIESRLARKDTIVRQLQSELELQQEKMTLMKNTLQKAAKGESVDIERTLARVESGYEPREKFLIEKRASILGLNNIFASGGGIASINTSNNSNQLNNNTNRIDRRSKSVANNNRQGFAGLASPVDKTKDATLPSPVAASPVNEPQKSLRPQHRSGQGTSPDNNNNSVPKSPEEAAPKMSFSEGEHLAIDDEDEDEDLMDTPWNREELVSLRQAKRELEIVVIEQEKKLEEMVSFEDSEDFRNLVLEMEEQREKIVNMEEEREGLKATISDLKNTIRKLELGRSELGAGGGGGGAAAPSGIPVLMATSPPRSSSSSIASSTSAASTSTSTLASSGAAGLASRVQELELMLQRERKFRAEEQAKSMGRVASLEAEVSILRAEQSVRELA